MKISTKKSIAWFFAIGGIGNILLLTVLCIQRGSLPNDLEIYLWQVGSVTATILSIRALRTAYREEPFNWHGFWQMSITEMLCLAFYTGLLLSIFQLMWPDALQFGIPLAIVTSLFTLWGLLLGARKGLRGTWRRVAYGIGWVYWWAGALGSGAMLGVCLLLLLTSRHELFKIIMAVLGSQSIPTQARWVADVFRAGLIMFPLGVVLTKLALRGLPQRGEKVDHVCQERNA